MEVSNIIDPSLETIDPTPNIHDLFMQFNRRFFWGTLGSVVVSWSKQMTSCAGVCSFHPRANFCAIRLSSPLLELRPRKDLVETLLHEMIHAYLFLTCNNKEREEHGPEFHKHMNRINKETGTNITVYHSFIDEVQYHQRHVWQCNGPCRKFPPYFGFYRSSRNRAPGTHCRWWYTHNAQCSGTFTKIEEPPGYSKKKTKDSKSKSGKDIRDFFTPNKATTSNIHTLKDITSTGKKAGQENVNIVNNGTGTGTGVRVPKYKHTATKSETLKLPNNQSKSDNVPTGKVQEQVRSIWANKYPEKRKIPETIHDNNKLMIVECDHCSELVATDYERHKENCVGKKINSCPVCCKPVQHSFLKDHLNECLNVSFAEDFFANEEEDNGDKGKVLCPICDSLVLEKTINSHIDECLTLKSLKEEV